jgi:hypothetical protein
MPPVTAQQKTHLRNLIHDVLMSPECQKIDFDFAFSHGYGYNRHKVDGWGFAHVALCLKTPLNSRRGVSVDVRDQTGQGIGASYDYGSNLLEVPSVAFGHTAAQRSSLVHECTHALRDAHGLKSRMNGFAGVPLGRTRGVEEEAEAYIAGALYIVYEARAGGFTLLTPSEPIFAAAQAIALTIADTPGALVGVGDHAALRKAILANPTYKRIMHGNMDFVYTPGPNGIRL